MCAMQLINSIEEQSSRENLRQLMHLRSLAVAGQLLTLLVAHGVFRLTLPVAAMLCVVGGLALLNLLSYWRLRQPRPVHISLLFGEMIFDVGALALQVYLSGGIANPFISLFLLQVILGALLLPTVYAWLLMVMTLCGYTALMFMPVKEVALLSPPALYSMGAWVSYALMASLSVWFLTRISRNLKKRDANYAALKQRLAEEEHVVRLGILASGAAHELGTPLSTLSVILNDWQDPSIPVNEKQRREDIALMVTEIGRCKKIVSDILLSAGEVRGEGAARVPLRIFMNGIVDEWSRLRQPGHLSYTYHPAEDIIIASDKIIERMLTSLLDNAFEASPDWIGMSVEREEDLLVIRISDKGEGFRPEILANIGQPDVTTKGAGHGTGLFLTANILRQLSGSFSARNLQEGGAEVTVRIQLSSLEVK